MTRVLVLAALLAVGAFAVQGGEYGTSDLWAQRGRERRLRAEIDSLQRRVDSLRQVKQSLLADAAVQERIAREEFGMVRGSKEILYRFAEPTSSPDSSARGR